MDSKSMLLLLVNGDDDDGDLNDLLDDTGDDTELF